MIELPRRKEVLFCGLLIFISFFTFGQVLVGVHNHTIAISPSYTVANNTTITVTGEIANLGTASINNNLHVHMAIDTSSTSVPKYYLRITRTYSTSNFLPAQTFTFSLTDIASTSNSYKVSGNGGSTIIVWATVGVPSASITTADSAFANVAIIVVPQGLHDLIKFESDAIIFPNPSSDIIKLEYDETIYTKVELSSVNSQAPIILINNKTFAIDYLSKGVYVLRFFNSKTETFITKKLIIE